VSEIEFSLPMYWATVYHNTPGTDGVWNKVFNCVGTRDDIIADVIRLFEEDGFNYARINRIEYEELISLRGGEENG
jgi:hypothetical protein